MEAAHHVDLTGIAIVALGALIFGFVMEKLRQPAIVGYIVAGVTLGPAGLSLVNARDGVEVLAEMGVLMLLFIIGMPMINSSIRTPISASTSTPSRALTNDRPAGPKVTPATM